MTTADHKGKNHASQRQLSFKWQAILTFVQLLALAAAVNQPSPQCADDLSPAAIQCSDVSRNEGVIFSAKEILAAMAKGAALGNPASWCPTLDKLTKDAADAPGQAGVKFVSVGLAKDAHNDPHAADHGMAVTGWYRLQHRR